MPTLHWIGKEKVVNHHQQVPYRVLEHQYGFTATDGEKKGTETGSGNKIIHGDNLEALKALLPEYEGRINCIYIDPPYNTGNEEWKYNDNVSDPKIKKWLGQTVGKESEDLSRHDKWLCMMYPRLRLLHKLLSKEGVLVISIGYQEVFNLMPILKVDYLHKLAEPIIHNEITPQNIMLDLSVNVPKAVIIDFGYARNFHQSTKSYNKEGLNFNYVASECFNNLYSPQSDIFSIGAVMYYSLYGMPPWFKDVSKFLADRTKAEELVIQERNKPLAFSTLSKDFVGYDESVTLILKKALSSDPENRFKSASEFIRALDGEIVVDDIEKIQTVKSDDKAEKKIKNKKTKGKGFDAIAGMKELKEQMQIDVIDALHKPEQYSKYGLTIPNGMLLYGPPGCGKTFFAKHFAEEVGFNFILATPSTLKSRYVNATQENIAKMFEDAEKNAPTIIFIDEINELLPNRDSEAHEMSKSAVNEMLAQMDRTGEKGIFVIGATNYPNMIDPAMLRAGRLDKKFYLPPPDYEARKSMFELWLINRPLDFGIDYERLAKLTENYVSADIELLVNDASRLALKTKKRISMKILEEVINNTKPTVSRQELKKYERIRAKMDGEDDDPKNERPRIGFKP